MKKIINENELTDWSKTLPKTGPSSIPPGMKEHVYTKIQNALHRKDEKRQRWSKWQPVAISIFVVCMVSWMFWTPEFVSKDRMIAQLVVVELDDAVDEVFSVVDSLGYFNMMSDNAQYPILEMEQQMAQLTSSEQDQILANIAQEMEQEWIDI